MNPDLLDAFIKRGLKVQEEIDARIAEHARKEAMSKQRIVPEPCRLSDYDRANVGEVLGDYNRHTHYGAWVMRLVKRADLEQREVLRRAYPEHVAAVETWERRGR